jgi:hypothetical protein
MTSLEGGPFVVPPTRVLPFKYSMAQPHAGEKDWFYCEPCDVTYLFRGNEAPGHKDEADIRCPMCDALLGHLRCDVYPPALMHQWPGKHLGRHD